MSEWANLCGTDGKVKARLNRLTGDLTIKERGIIHIWNIKDLIGACSASSTQYANMTSELLDNQAVKVAS